MLYKKNAVPELSEELFRNPTAEYRGTPFWAWNGKLDKETLRAEIDTMKTMGFGGFHMHVRTGMATPYLTDEYMDFIQTCIDKAKEEDMLAWLYDEDRWPSGTAGGLVTREHPEHATKSLMFTRKPYETAGQERTTSVPGMGKGAVRQNNGYLLAVFDILLNADGTLQQYHRIPVEGEAVPEPEENRWYIYLEHGSADPWFNDAPYVDTLSKEAVRSFLDITHETYARTVGAEFGKTVPAIFTDEPQLNTKNTLNFAKEEKDVFLPWASDLPETMKEACGTDILDKLPELLWELPEGKISTVRYQYHDHLASRFAESFCGQIGQWCQDHGIALTGHVNGEGELSSQTRVVGEAMRSYRHFGIPGIDMLCDFHEYNTAKQTQSIVHQAGKEAMMSELYGVTGWDCDFRTYKLQGDWQAALGVTVRVPHLYWMTMKGEAKRDYPASIGHQSPWWDQYSLIEDHFSRLNTALTRGTPIVKVAVLHPIETYWLHWGSTEQTGSFRDTMEKQFAELTQWLLFNQIDFDFISENELPLFCEQGGNPLKVGKMQYDAVLISGCETLRSTTLERLEDFRKAGGDLIFVGEAPKYEDAIPSARPKNLYQQSRAVDYSKEAILGALEPYRLIDVRMPDGKREERVIYQYRQDQMNRWLFLCNDQNPICKDVDDAPRDRFTVQGTWKVTLYDTMTGETRPMEAEYQQGMTILSVKWHHHDSMLLRLDPITVVSDTVRADAAEADAFVESIFEGDEAQYLLDPVDYTLDEPNMLLLDLAEYAIDDAPYEKREEILRLDYLVRKALGIPPRRKEITQPYLIPEDEPEHTVRLRFRFQCEIVTEAWIALEDAAQISIRMNGVDVPSVIDGWFVDRCIEKVKLPDLQIGENIIELVVPIGPRTNLENCYLLGDFGVRIAGTQQTVTRRAAKIGFGDISYQGLPFYTGCITYHFTVEGPCEIQVPRYRGGLIRVEADGVDQGPIAFSPYKVDLSGLEEGTHTISLKLYGTRQNGFAQLHHTPGIYFYQSANSFRSSGQLWNYEYSLKEAGILASPKITRPCVNKC